MALADESGITRRSTAGCVCVEFHRFLFRRICRVANHRELLRVSVGGSEVCCRLDTQLVYHIWLAFSLWKTNDAVRTAVKSPRITTFHRTTFETHRQTLCNRMYVMSATHS